MLVDYPHEWHKYFLDGKGRTFSKDTPKEIVEKAKDINKTTMKYGGKNFFSFENDND